MTKISATNNRQRSQSAPPRLPSPVKRCNQGDEVSSVGSEFNNMIILQEQSSGRATEQDATSRLSSSSSNTSSDIIPNRGRPRSASVPNEITVSKP